MSENFTVITVWLLVLFFSLDVQGNQLLNYELEEKLSLSDIVILGKIKSLSKKHLPGAEVEIAHVEVLGVAKGHVKLKSDVEFVYREGVAELNSECCVVDEEYLMFLSKGRTGMYFSVDGRFGVYRLDGESD